LPVTGGPLFQMGEFVKIYVLGRARGCLGPSPNLNGFC